VARQLKVRCHVAYFYSHWHSSWKNLTALVYGLCQPHGEVKPIRTHRLTGFVAVFVGRFDKA
jgi:hypothetical protein